MLETEVRHRKQCRADDGNHGDQTDEPPSEQYEGYEGRHEADRREVPRADCPGHPGYDHHHGCSHLDEDVDSQSVVDEFLSWVNILVGLVVMVTLALRYSLHLKQLHEAEMWFSNIKVIEQEISFRTESGLYYSYYKQMIQAPSIAHGIYELMHDNITEHPSTINVLARMNIYQEVILAAIYREAPFIKELYKPVEFYTATVFHLQGLMLSALYITTWLLSGTWVAGVLMAAFHVFNREDVTRVNATIPLRENWSLPFFWIQIMLLTVYFRPALSTLKQRGCTVGLILSTSLFAITWQFNQFVLLLQAMALFGTQLLGLLPQHKIVRVYLVQLLAMVVVCILQFGNMMILTGLLFSFVPAALVIMYIQNHHFPVCRSGLLSSVAKVLLYIVAVMVLMLLFNMLIKLALNEEADEHIYKFVLSKFGWNNPRDFDVSLYVCNGAFQFLPLSTFIRLSLKLVFPIYLLVHTVILATIASDLVYTWSDARMEDAPRQKDSPSMEAESFSDRPQLTYHAIQAVFYGLMALSTMRMKYFWTPYVFVLASAGLCDLGFWTWFMASINIHSKFLVNIVRHGVMVLVLAILLYIALPQALKELEDLREFYDPDTVDLMHWIQEHTSETAAFSGSMQLLAGVKLCTGRHITNHPHYEDKHLRSKTKQLYQMYGHRTPEEVHAILTKYESDYIILEDSICLSPRVGCRLPDLIDLDNGVIPRDGPQYPGLVATEIPLFCDEIRHGKPHYTKYFKRVFINHTFRVYKVLRLLHHAA